MKRLLILTISILLEIVLISSPVLISALDIIQPADIGVDTTNLQVDTSFSIPNKVLVTPLFVSEEDGLNPIDWFRGLHYYLTGGGSRPGFTDIPFHYVIDSSGQVFAGNQGGEERKVFVDGYGTDAIVIAYLADAGANTFNPRSTAELQELLTGVVNRQAIQPDKISVESVRFKLDAEAQTVSLEKQDIFGLWKKDLEAIKANVKKNYKPKAKTYEMGILAVDYPQDPVDSGGIVEGTVTIENSGEYGVYAGTLSELIATRVGGSSSRFYVNDQWLSPGQFGLMDEDAVLLPGSQATFTFKLATPLYFGKQTERFSLQNVAGTKIADSEFEITLDIKRPEGTIVEVLDTPTGFLRVRSRPFGLEDNEIARVSPGQRFFLIEPTNSAGWAKIKLNDGREGWVAGNYIRGV